MPPAVQLILCCPDVRASGVECKFSTDGKGKPLPGGKVNTPHNPRYPSSATFECDDGHYLVGTTSVACTKAGIFPMDGISCSQCVAVGVGHHCPTGKVRCKSDGKHNQIASFCASAADCDEGFGADGYCTCALIICQFFIKSDFGTIFLISCCLARSDSM